MQKRNHIWLGAVFVFLFIMLLGWLNLGWIAFTLGSVLTIICITIFYSLLPDIDHKNSTITWWFFGAGILGLVVGMLEMKFDFLDTGAWTIMLISTALLAFTFIATNIFEHRGIIHTVQVGIISAVPLWFLFHSFAYCLVGYIAWHSHLIGDGYIFKIR